MVNFVHQSGDCVALGYPYLVKIKFQPSQGMTLTFTDTKVTLEGRNLAPIYHGLVAHQLKVISEIDPQYDDRPEGETVVNRITVEDVIV